MFAELRILEVTLVLLPTVMHSSSVERVTFIPMWRGQLNSRLNPSAVFCIKGVSVRVWVDLLLSKAQLIIPT
jgi:hypothetical protein